MIKFFLQILVFIIITNSVAGQKGLELGAWVGMAHYYGDLQTELAITDPGFAGGLIFRYNFDKRISVKSSFNIGRLSASDNDSQNTFERQRNLSFNSNVFDLTTQLEFNFLQYIHGSEDYFFTPYLFAGMSFFAFSPKTDLNEVTYNLRDYGTEGQAIGNEYGRFSFSPTIGLGLKWDINFEWSFNVELSIHNSRTDYLDDVSGVYPDLTNLNNTRGQTAVNLSDRSVGGGIGESFRQRGNSRNNDTYVFFGIGIVRYFGTLPCPVATKKKR